MKNENEWVTGNVTLSIDGRPLEMQMTVPAAAVKPQRMLPIFQKMTDAFVGMGIEESGEPVSCRAGCGACCRQAVPIAEIEAYRIAEIVAALPDERRTEVESRFEAAVAQLSGAGWLSRLDACASAGHDERHAVVLEYFGFGIACPFLVDESCSIHSDRPLACREYLVSSPAENCANPTAESVRMIPIPIKTAAVVRQIGQRRQLAGVDFIPLVLALKWVENKTDEFPEKTGERWMADFFGFLTRKDVPTGPGA